MFKTSLKYGGILLIVAVICTVAVSSVYVIVNPIIAERKTLKVRENLNQIYSGLEFNYKDVTNKYGLNDSDIIDALYEVLLPNGETNYVYEMSPKGRNDEIVFLLAFDTNGKVLKIQYVQMRETKGRGDKITKANYLDRIYAQNASNMNVDMITGATYSSRAMKESIEAASKHLSGVVLK